MDKITLDPYIFFAGDASAAMEFYKNIFGGQLEIQTYDDVPGPTQAGMEGKIMHAMLSGGDIRLMASDTPGASPKAAKVSLSLGGTDDAKLRKIFEGLSEDVEVQYPLKKEFWGDIFGSLTDKFGVEWMVNITLPKEANSPVA
jgi:PhnB protein